MNQTIHKFPLPVEGEFSIEMPKFAHILCVQTQRGTPCIWATVDTSQPMETRIFRIFGTGHPLDENHNSSHYIGTFQLAERYFVGHLFEPERR